VLFRLIKLGIGLVGLVAFAWFGITFKLGDRTLFQHLRAIGETKESQELVEGTRQAAAPIVDDVRRRISGKQEEGPDAGAPLDRLSSSEQRQLRELLRKVDGKKVDSKSGTTASP
jgi:hypothetical protein